MPGAKLIAQRLDVKESEVIEMDQRLSGRDLSTDAPMGEGETATLLNTLTDDSPTPEERLRRRSTARPSRSGSRPLARV